MKYFRVCRFGLVIWSLLILLFSLYTIIYITAKTAISNTPSTILSSNQIEKLNSDIESFNKQRLNQNKVKKEKKKKYFNFKKKLIINSLIV